VLVHELKNMDHILQVETFTKKIKTTKKEIDEKEEKRENIGNFQNFIKIDEDNQNGEADVGVIDIKIVFGKLSNFSKYAFISLSWDNSPHGPVFPVSVKNSDGIPFGILENVTVPNAKLWSVKNPHLHTLLVSLHDPNNKSTIFDSVHVRFGIRVISTQKIPGKNARLKINDQIVKLHGVNRHTMWPDTGASGNSTKVRHDISLLRKMGSNYVRGGHYAQDQFFLDLCDENGIVVWEETLGPSTTVKNLNDPYVCRWRSNYSIFCNFSSNHLVFLRNIFNGIFFRYFMKYQVEALNEMISASINHPSVIFHGFFNEGPSDEISACSGYKTCAETIQKRVGNPPTRLVTWASNKGSRDQCLHHADIVSFNSYPAWYTFPHNLSAIVPEWKSLANFVRQKFPEKPFTISEAGAGGVYEWNNTTDPMWSQKFQAEVHNATATLAISDDSFSGITIWQFSDIKANDDATQKCGQCLYKNHPKSLSFPWDCAYINVTCGRPGGENHKGVVDFWRREKLGFEVLTKIYQKAE
jgi:hypothetical protein